MLLTKDATTKLSTHLCISAQYVLINQTEFTIQVQSEATYKNKKTIGQVFSIPPHDDGQPLVMFSHPNSKSVKNRARIRVADSNWSEPVSFEAVGAELELDCKSMLVSKWYNLGGLVSLGQGKVKLGGVE
jgi:vacuolar protein sorting-associated protein 13A/C